MDPWASNGRLIPLESVLYTGVTRKPVGIGIPNNL